MKDEERKELSEEELEKISGGDYGDSDAEKEGCGFGHVNYMYNIGDVVEVYFYKFHIAGLWTKRGKIVGRHVYFDGYGGWEASYDVLYDGDTKPTNFVSADSIQSS